MVPQQRAGAARAGLRGGGCAALLLGVVTVGSAPVYAAATCGASSMQCPNCLARLTTIDYEGVAIETCQRQGTS